MASVCDFEMWFTILIALDQYLLLNQLFKTKLSILVSTRNVFNRLMSQTEFKSQGNM